MDEEKERRDKGARGELWRIEIYYRGEDVGELKRMELTNQTGNEVMNFRNMVFTAGLTEFLDPGHWRVIFPSDLVKIELWKQKKFFEP